MHIQRKGSKDKALSEAQQRRNRRIASPFCRPRTTGWQDAALHRLGARHAASELESGSLQLAPLVYLKEAGVAAF